MFFLFQTLGAFLGAAIVYGMYFGTSRRIIRLSKKPVFTRSYNVQTNQDGCNILWYIVLVALGVLIKTFSAATISYLSKHASELMSIYTSTHFCMSSLIWHIFSGFLFAGSLGEVIN